MKDTTKTPEPEASDEPTANSASRRVKLILTAMTRQTDALEHQRAQYANAGTEAGDLAAGTLEDVIRILDGTWERIAELDNGVHTQ